MAKLPAQDIVERLRAATMRFDWADIPDEEPIPAIPLLREAADTISRLTADNEALTKHIAFLRDALGKDRKSIWRDAKLSASTEEAIEAVLEWGADSARAALGDRP